MYRKTKSIVSGFLAVLMLFSAVFFGFSFPKIWAAGISNIAINFNNSIVSGSGAVNVAFDIAEAIPANGKVEIEFPADFSDLNISSATGTNLGTNPVFGTGDTATTVQIILGTGGANTGATLTASGFTLTNPAEDGFYLVQIRTYDENEIILAMGFKLVSIGTPVDIKSKVEESLVVSLDAGTKVFSPDPMINGGRVTDQASTLTVQTNAETAYLVTGELLNNKLSAGTGADILSNNNADDYFRIGNVELNLESGTGSAIVDNSIFSDSTSLFSKSSGVSTNGDLISIHYDLNISYYKAVGNYTGGIVYSVYPTF